MNKEFVYPLFLSALLAASLASTGALAAEEATGVEAEAEACDDKDARDRGRSKRRRSGGSNRDCEYREVVVDQDTGEVLREAPVAVQRSVLPRRYSNLPRPIKQ